jgi:hypothetical protein
LRISVLPPLLPQNTDAGFASAQALCGPMSSMPMQINPKVRRILFSRVACCCGWAILSDRGRSRIGHCGLSMHQWTTRLGTQLDCPQQQQRHRHHERRDDGKIQNTSM